MSAKIITGRFGYPVHGFDCNQVVTARDALSMRKAGFSFAIRYIRRSTRSLSDLSTNEIKALFDAGLAVMPVQHVESERSWTPMNDKGRLYGTNAVTSCVDLGIPKGTTVWLDLEGVDKAVDAESIIHYCNYWHDKVAFAGYQPGIYIGWNNGLTPDQLYSRLKFTRYWSAYNLNTDQYPSRRGVCMKQGVGKAPTDTLLGIDIDVITGDMLGGYPSLYAPDEWDPQ